MSSLADLLYARRQYPGRPIDVDRFQEIGAQVAAAVNDITDALARTPSTDAPTLVETWADSLLRHLDDKGLLVSYGILEQKFQWYVTQQLQGINTVLVSKRLGRPAASGPDPDVDHYLEGVRDQLRTEIDAFLAAVEKLVIGAVPPVSGFGRAPQWPTSVLTVFRRCDLIADGLAGAFDPCTSQHATRRCVRTPHRAPEPSAGCGSPPPGPAAVAAGRRLVPLGPEHRADRLTRTGRRLAWVDSEGYARVDPGARLFVDRVRATGCSTTGVRLSPPPGRSRLSRHRSRGMSGSGWW